MKVSKLGNLTEGFMKTLQVQLEHDGIEIDYETLSGIVGEIRLCETNNDRSVNGSLNSNLFIMEYRKVKYGSFENLPFRKINTSLNSLPVKMLKWKSPKEVMNENLKAYL
jgi:hypothetical protein